MTLTEAIEHAIEQSESLCGECAKEHKQLADWLNELDIIKNIIYTTDRSSSECCQVAIDEILASL